MRSSIKKQTYNSKPKLQQEHATPKSMKIIKKDPIPISEEEDSSPFPVEEATNRHADDWRGCRWAYRAYSL